MMDNSLPAAKIALEKQLVLSAAFPWESDAGLMDFLRAFPKETRIFFSSPNSGLAFAGVGQVATIKGHGTRRFATVKESLRALEFEVVQPDTFPHGFSLPRLFGGFSFAPDFSAGGDWFGFDAATFVLPGYLLVSTGNETWLILNRLVSAGRDGKSTHAQRKDEFERIEQLVVSNLDSSAKNRGANTVEIQHEMSQKEWVGAVNAIKQELQGGALEKAVLARIMRLQFSKDIDCLNALQELIDAYPNCTHFLSAFSANNAFLGATPECLAAVDNRALRTMALAGSIRRGETPEEDHELGQRLIESEKDQREHDYVVNTLGDALDPLTKSLEFPEKPYLYKLPNVQHLRSDIEALLNQDVDILDVVEALHPTPALGGVPRQRALEMIAALESGSRGWYGAPVGWLDEHGDGEFVVGIRSGVVRGHSASIYAGVGIVVDSDPLLEWDETELKFEPMRKAFTGTLE